MLGVSTHLLLTFFQLPYTNDYTSCSSIVALLQRLCLLLQFLVSSYNFA